LRRGISGGVSTQTDPAFPARVAIAGASGLLGSALARSLASDGIQIVRIGRGADADVRWDPARGAIDASALRGVDAVVALAGANIGQRWTAAQRAEIRASRVDATSLLARTIAMLDPRPRVFVSGSAIGVYGNRGDDVLTEESEPGTGFLADVVREWERAADPARRAGIPTTCARTGVAITFAGGMLERIALPFRLGLGGVMGNGAQWLSWISRHDHVRAIRFLLTHVLPGPVNVVAPGPVTNSGFTAALGRALHRPTLMRIPTGALRLAFGPMAEETILVSQRVMPARLASAGFVFDDPTIDAALARKDGADGR